MTLVRNYEPSFVLGDGETKEFSFLFEHVSDDFIKVIIKHVDGTTYVPTFSVDLEMSKVVLGEDESAPLETDLICIYRETPDIQDTPFKTLQGYDAKSLELILTKIVAMIQEIKAVGVNTSILQGDTWQLDVLKPADNGANVVIDYTAKILKRGLYFKITGGNLQVSADDEYYITMPNSSDIKEIRQGYLDDVENPHYYFEYRVGNNWYTIDTGDGAVALETAREAKEMVVNLATVVDGKQDKLPDGTTGYYLQKTDSGVQWAEAENNLTESDNTWTGVNEFEDTVMAEEITDGNGINIISVGDTDSRNVGSVVKPMQLNASGDITVRKLTEDNVGVVLDSLNYTNYHDDTKQNVISDLANIRSGASAGATALQPSALTAHNESDTAHQDIRDLVESLVYTKVPNAVVVGNLSEDNGEFSGFTTTDYMKFPFIVDLSDTEFDIYFAFTTSNNVIDDQAIMDSKFGLSVMLYAGKLRLSISEDGEDWTIRGEQGLTDISGRQKYYCRLSYHDETYKLLISEDNVEFTEDIVLENMSFTPYPKTMYIGGGNETELEASFPFDGSIDLKEARVVINNQPVWNGMDMVGLVTKANISLSNLDADGKAMFEAKQDKLTAGDNINIDNNIVSATVPKMEVVDELPADPEEDKFYFIKE